MSEIYDRIGFAAVGRYNEFESLRVAGIRLTDLRGYSYDRRDVTARALANAYAQTLGTIFTEQQKPYEVELCVAEVGDTADGDQLYRLTYDGTIVEEPQFMVMGGQAETLTTEMKSSFVAHQPLREALHVAVRALGTTGAAGGDHRTIPGAQLEVAVLDRNRGQRKFRRITGLALTDLLPPAVSGDTPSEPAPVDTPPHDVQDRDAAAESSGAATPDEGAAGSDGTENGSGRS